MNEAAKLLLQYEDFSCFSKAHTQVKTNRCNIKYASWALENLGLNQTECLVFTIQANRFLRGMVRAIVGTLLEIGIGNKTIKQFKEIIESKDRSQAGMSVEPHGLYLTQVLYPEELL